MHVGNFCNSSLYLTSFTMICPIADGDTLALVAARAPSHLSATADAASLYELQPAHKTAHVALRWRHAAKRRKKLAPNEQPESTLQP